MNKRFVLISAKETPNYVVDYYGIGLDSSQIFTVENIESMSDDAKREFLTLGPSDAVMLVGAEPYRYLNQFYHFGVRSENYFDVSKLRRLSIEGGAFVKVVLDPPSPDIIRDFMSPGFTQPVDFSWFQSKVIHDFTGAMKFLDWLDNLPEEEEAHV